MVHQDVGNNRWDFLEPWTRLPALLAENVTVDKVVGNTCWDCSDRLTRLLAMLGEVILKECQGFWRSWVVSR